MSARRERLNKGVEWSWPSAALVLCIGVVGAAFTPFAPDRTGRAAEWALEPELWIAKSAASFGTVGALAADSAGRIYAFDESAQALKTFSSAGALVSSFGRGGTEPGEFQGVVGVSVAPGGDVWVVDAKSDRYTNLRRGRTSTFPRSAPVWRSPWVGGVGRAGALYDAVVDGATGKEVLVRVDTAGRVTDTIRIPAPTLSLPRRGRLELPLPHGPRVLRAFDARGFVWLAVSDQYRLVKVSWKGDTVVVASRPEHAIPLTPQQNDSVARYARMLATDMQVDVEPSQLPRVLPLLRWMVVDDRGFLWVSVAQPGGTPALDVFDGSGKYQGRVRSDLKLAAVVPVIRGDKFYAVARDSSGALAIVEARIHGRR